MVPNFERLDAVLRREEPDRVPNYEHLIDTHVMEFIMGKPAPLIKAHDKTSKIAHMEYLISFFSRMGYDYVPLELGLNLFRLNVSVSHAKEPLGSSSRSWVDNERATIANCDEFNEYSWPEPSKAVDYQLLEAAGEVLPKGMKLVSGVAGGVHEHVMWLVGLKQFSIALRREPTFLKKMFDKVGDLIAAVDSIIVEYNHVGAMRMGDDMGYKGRTMLDPKLLRKWVFPKQKEIVKVAHNHDKPFILHSCGNLNEIIDDLIDEVGIDAWHSFQDIILPVTKRRKNLIQGWQYSVGSIFIPYALPHVIFLENIV